MKKVDFSGIDVIIYDIRMYIVKMALRTEGLITLTFIITLLSKSNIHVHRMDIQ